MAIIREEDNVKKECLEILENSLDKIKDFLMSEFEQYDEKGRPFHLEKDLKKISNVCQWLDQCYYFDIKERIENE